MIKKLLLALLLCAMPALAVDTLTVSSTGGQIAKIEWNWTADSSGNASGATADVVPGFLYSIATVPDTAQVPTDNYDVVIYNQYAAVTGSDVVLSSTDLLGGIGANRDSVNTEAVEIWPTYLKQATGKIRIQVSNAGNAKKGKIVLGVYRSLAIINDGGCDAGTYGVPLGGTIGQILQNCANGQAKWVTMSGDATLDDSGALTVASGAITAAKTSITGTPNGTMFLRDDWSWQNVGGGSGIGDVVGPASAVNGAIPTWDGTTGKLLRSTGLLWDSAALTVPGGVALSTGNAFYTPNGSYGLYESTVTSGNQRALFKLDNTSESSTWGGNAAGVYLTDNSGLSGYYAIFLPRDPSVAAEIRKPLTATGVITGPAATTSKASFNAPHGTAPSAPTNGDIWTTTGGAYVRVNGATQKMPDLGTAETITGNWVNTANPWADNEVSDTLTIGSGSTMSSPPAIGGVAPNTGAFTTLSSSGDATLGGTGAGTRNVSFNRAANNDLRFDYKSNSQTRWCWFMRPDNATATTEANLVLQAFDLSGVYVDDALEWQRQSGGTFTFKRPVSVGSNVLTASSASNAIRIGTSSDLTTPPAIGGTTPAAGTFTTVTSTGNFNSTSSTQTFIYNTPASGAANIRLCPLPFDTSSTADVDFFRQTNTNAAVSFNIRKGDNTSTSVFSIVSGASPATTFKNSSGTTKLTVDHNTGNLTTLGTVTAGSGATVLTNSTGTIKGAALENSGVSAGTYSSVTVGANGLVTAGTNPSGTTVIYSNVTTVGNVGTGEDNLMSFTVPASQLAADKDSITFSGIYKVVSGVTETLRIYFGSTKIFELAVSPIGLSRLNVRGEIIRTGATTQRSIVSLETEGSSFVNTQYATPAETLSSTVTFKSTGEATSNNDIEQYWFKVKYDKGV